MSVTLPNQPIRPTDDIQSAVQELGWDWRRDIEIGAPQGTPLVGTDESNQKSVGREKSNAPRLSRWPSQKIIGREKSLAPRLSRWPSVASTAQISMKKTQSDVIINHWDVFISYRVKADAKLAEDLYWKLSATDIVDCGSTRRLRVFWDKGRRLLPLLAFVSALSL